MTRSNSQTDEPAAARRPFLSLASASIDRWLTPARVRAYAALAVVVSAAAMLGLVVLGEPPFDARGRSIAEDLAPRVAAGRLAVTGRLAELYEPEIVDAVLEREVLGRSDPNPTIGFFLLPPFAALFYAPFAALPYVAAAGLWTLLSVALLVAGLLWTSRLLPANRLRFSSVLLVSFSSAPVIELLGNGQDAAISFALMSGGLTLLAAGHDARAGALLGLGLFKPQLFALFPVLFALEWRPRALAAWTATALALAVLSLALVGLEGAREYFELLDSNLYRAGVAEDLRWKMQSLPALADSLLPAGLRLRANAPRLLDVWPLAAGGAFLAVALRGPLKGAPVTASFPLTVLVTAAVCPHFFLYDATIVLIPAVLAAGEAPENPRLRALGLVTYTLLWTAPLRHVFFGGLAWPFSMLSAPWAALGFAALAREAIRSPLLSSTSEPASTT